jgi:hypothetical protein
LGELRISLFCFFFHSYLKIIWINNWINVGVVTRVGSWKTFELWKFTFALIMIEEEIDWKRTCVIFSLKFFWMTQMALSFEKINQYVIIVSEIRLLIFCGKTQWIKSWKIVICAISSYAFLSKFLCFSVDIISYSGVISQQNLNWKTQINLIDIGRRWELNSW